MPITPVTAIPRLATEIEAEMAELHFDYLLLHHTCWLTLSRLKLVLNEPLKRACEGNADYIKSEAQLPQVAGIILRAAAGKAPGLEPKDSFELLEEVRVGIKSIIDKGMGKVVADQMSALGVGTASS